VLLYLENIAEENKNKLAIASFLTGFSRPATSLGHQEGRRVAEMNPKFLNYVQ